MTRPLPPRPNLDQLRHQARDLLRRHRRGDASSRERLRHLRPFRELSNRQLEAVDLKLCQAQYALALDYGFSSWDAMKRHVASIAGNGQGPRWRRDGQATVLSGLEHIVVGSDSMRQNSVLACLTAALQIDGMDITYQQLMGLSGAVFRLQYNGCPSGACAECGFDLTARAAEVLGLDLQRFGTGSHQAPPDPADLESSRQRARAAVAESIRRGVPGLWSSEECGLIVGYTDPGQWLLRKYSPSQPGYETVDGWPWSVWVVEPGTRQRPGLEACLDALLLGCRLHETEAFGPYPSGRAAYRRWIRDLRADNFADGLTEDNWFGRALGNGYTYGTLFCARQLAEEFLRDLAEDVRAGGKAASAEALDQAAEAARKHWQHMDTPREGIACPWSLQPWHLGSRENWTTGLRRRQAEVLEELAVIDEQMFASMARALAAL